MWHKKHVGIGGMGKEFSKVFLFLMPKPTSRGSLTMIRQKRGKPFRFFFPLSLGSSCRSWVSHAHAACYYSVSQLPTRHKLTEMFYPAKLYKLLEGESLVLFQTTASEVAQGNILDARSLDHMVYINHFITRKSLFNWLPNCALTQRFAKFSFGEVSGKTQLLFSFHKEVQILHMTLVYNVWYSYD